MFPSASVLWSHQIICSSFHLCSFCIYGLNCSWNSLLFFHLANFYSPYHNKFRLFLNIFPLSDSIHWKILMSSILHSLRILSPPQKSWYHRIIIYLCRQKTEILKTRNQSEFPGTPNSSMINGKWPRDWVIKENVDQKTAGRKILWDLSFTGDNPHK